MQSIYFP